MTSLLNYFLIKKYNRFKFDKSISLGCEQMYIYEPEVEKLFEDFSTSLKSFVQPKQVSLDPLLARFACELVNNSFDSIKLRKEGTQDRGYAGKVILRISASSGRLKFLVEDNGLGIDPRIEPFLFKELDPLETIPRSATKFSLERGMDERFLGGAQTGLYWIHTTLLREGGEISYQNKGSFQGAKFEFTYPLSGFVFGTKMRTNNL